MDFQPIDQKQCEMTSRSTRSNSMLVPSTYCPENISQDIQGRESYIAARDPLAHQQPQAAEMST